MEEEDRSRVSDGESTVLRLGAIVQRPCSEREHREPGNEKKGS